VRRAGELGSSLNGRSPSTVCARASSSSSGEFAKDALDGIASVHLELERVGLHLSASLL
jgi:hypothetical protein